MVKKHVKTTKEKKGGIISKENFIHISNLKSLEKEDKNINPSIMDDTPSRPDTDEFKNQLSNPVSEETSHTSVEHVVAPSESKPILGLFTFSRIFLSGNFGTLVL
mgnify:CR=1 FL=1